MTVMIGYAPSCAKLTNKEKLFVFILLFITGPAFILVSVCSSILETILPEGWDDDIGSSRY
jgi:hypothetical protein